MNKKQTLSLVLGLVVVGGAYFAFKAITKPSKKASATGKLAAGPKKCKTQSDCPSGTTCVGDNPRVCVGSPIQTSSF